MTLHDFSVSGNLFHSIDDEINVEIGNRIVEEIHRCSLREWV